MPKQATLGCCVRFLFLTPRRWRGSNYCGCWHVSSPGTSRAFVLILEFDWCAISPRVRRGHCVRCGDS